MINNVSPKVPYANFQSQKQSNSFSPAPSALPTPRFMPSMANSQPSFGNSFFRKPASYSNTPPYPLKFVNKASTRTQSSNASVNVPAKPVSRKEYDEKRKNNLCFYCNEKYFRGANSKVYMLLYPDEVEEHQEEPVVTSEMEQIDTDNEEITLSLHALLGTTGMHTLQLHGLVKKQKVLMLVDSGSTSNFIDLSLAKSLGLELLPIKRLQVAVADGFTLPVQFMCKKVCWSAQGAKFCTDLLAMPIGGLALFWEFNG